MKIFKLEEIKKYITNSKLNFVSVDDFIEFTRLNCVDSSFISKLEGYVYRSLQRTPFHAGPWWKKNIKSIDKTWDSITITMQPELYFIGVPIIDISYHNEKTKALREKLSITEAVSSVEKLLKRKAKSKFNYSEPDYEKKKFEEVI